jgi:enamine deaminase RidA (YjgF/YER057c/UK114 family)
MVVPRMATSAIAWGASNTRCGTSVLARAVPQGTFAANTTAVIGPGRVVYVSGQLGVHRGKLVGAPGDFRAQTLQAFENVQTALAAIGANFSHVVKMNSYLLDMTHLPILREVRDRFLNTNAPPASTTVEVPKLVREGAVFEIDVVAVLPALG